MSLEIRDMHCVNVDDPNKYSVLKEAAFGGTEFKTKAQRMSPYKHGARRRVVGSLCIRRPNAASFMEAGLLRRVIMQP